MAATAPLLGLEKKSLREQALSALRIAITSGELEPGRHLVETELSDMLQISRGTLREALRQLEQEGLLSAGPRGRLSVRHLDAKLAQALGDPGAVAVGDRPGDDLGAGDDDARANAHAVNLYGSGDATAGSGSARSSPPLSTRLRSAIETRTCRGFEPS